MPDDQPDMTPTEAVELLYAHIRGERPDGERLQMALAIVTKEVAEELEREKHNDGRGRVQ